MTSNLAILGFCLIMTTNIFGQAKVTEKKFQTYDANVGKWKVQELEETEYDEAERPILWNAYTRRWEEDSLINYQRIENIYTTNQCEEYYYKWDYPKSQLMPISLETWEYNADGCPTQRKFRTLEGSDVNNENRKKMVIQYQSDAPLCTVKEEITSIYIADLHTDFINQSRNTYTYENDFKTVTKESYIWIETSQSWNLATTKTTQYDANGNELVREIVSTNGLSSDFRWAYDEAGRVVEFESNQYEDELLKNHKLIFMEYELDDNDFVVQKERKCVESGRKDEYFYENYCDGLVRVEREFDDMTLSFKETHFKYLHGTECEVFEEKLNLLLYPNPTGGKLNLQSDLLTTASAQVEIYNMAGQKLRVFDVSQRTENIEIEVSDLAVGSYVVRVISDEYSVAEKLIISSF